jgi:DNA-binding NarL/FixJ family response regulator
LEGTPDFSLEAAAVAAGVQADSNDRKFVCEPVPILGLVADDTSDALVLRMLDQLLTASGCSMEIIKDTDSSLQVVERVADEAPRLVIVSHLPPEGSTLARYLIRRLRAQFAELPIVVGRWGGETEGSASAVERLVEAGASRVVVNLFDARAHILSAAAPKSNAVAVTTAVSG